MEVIEPCPISVAADMIVVVPSGAILTQGLMVFPARSVPMMAASVRPPRTSAKERPAAPIITSRRETGFSNALCAVMSRLPCRALDSTHNSLICAAAADIGAHVLDDLLAGWLGIVLEQIGRAHDLAGLAVAALRHSLGEPGLLHRMA